MGLLPLEYTDCLTDTPHYRENLRAHEKELERTSQAIKGLIKEVKDLLNAAKNGKKQFCPEEYLTQDQVMSYFSSLKGKSKNLDAVRDYENEEDDELLQLKKMRNYVPDDRVHCLCTSDQNNYFVNSDYGHIVTGDLSIIKDLKLQQIMKRALSKAQRSLASTLMNFRFDCIGSSQTDDEIIIAGSLKEFGRLLNVIEDERDRMLDRAQVALIDPIENFRKENIGAAKEGKKKFEKETARFCQSLERHLNLSTKKSENHLLEADASLEMEQRHFYLASLEYASLLTSIQEKKKFEFVETILSFMCGMMTFYHQGYEVANEFKTFITDLQRRLQRTRENFEATYNEAEQLKQKTLEKAQDPGTLNKMYTRQGYLFLMEKKALSTTWTKHFCQYQKNQKKFSMMPYSQTVGKVMNGETITVKECIGRNYDSIDKRFCFDVVAEDKPVPYTFQALSDEDRKLWLDAMDGKEPANNATGKSSKQEGFSLDEGGFAFIQWCINFIESKGLTDQGLYRLVGVNSKVARLTQLALENRDQNLAVLDEEEWELKTVTSALKNFYRNLPEPLLTFRLHGAFIAAAKLDNKAIRINNIHALVHSLPKPAFQMLELLIRHLVKIAKLSNKNLMTISNLGICFGPTLLRPEEETVAAIMDIKFGNVVVEILIENCDKIFGSVPEIDLMRRQPPPYIPPPQPIRKDEHQSPPTRHLSPIRSSSTDNFLGRNNHQSAINVVHPYNVGYSATTHTGIAPEKTRSGIMMYNPMWNNGLPTSSSLESLSIRSYPPPRPPLPEQKDYVYPSSWGSEISPQPHKNPKTNVDLTSKEYFVPDELPPNTMSPPHSNVKSGLRARTLYACRGENEMELSFEPNEVIYNVVPSQEPGWIRGTLKGRTGLVPENYVQYIS